MAVRAVAFLVFAVCLAGCVEESPAPETVETAAARTAGPPLPPPPVVAPADALAAEAVAPALALPATVEGTCPACEVVRISLDADLPSRAWLEVRVSWNGTETPGIGLAVSGPDGVHAAQRGYDAFRVKVNGAVAGIYEAHLAGTGDYRLEASVTDALRPKSDTEARLPDLVTMVPVQVGFGTCDEVERTEQGAQRCLRLGNAIGNVGDGPMEVMLTVPQGALALAGESGGPVDGVFKQRLHSWDGAVQERDVGSADFHAAHAHWHYDGFADFKLYAVDPVTGLRTGEAAAGHKSGFCFLDWGEMEEDETEAHGGGRASQDCLVPLTDGWSMGISTGYFDFYWAGLTDQYVEASGVQDGWYELVSVADPDDWLLEVDETDNTASVLIRIEGDTVEVVEGRGWYRLPDDTNNL